MAVKEVTLFDVEGVLFLVSDKITTLSDFYMKDWTLRLDEDSFSLEIKYFFTRKYDRKTKWNKLVNEIFKLKKYLFDSNLEIEFSLGGDDQGDYLRLMIQ